MANRCWNNFGAWLKVHREGDGHNTRYLEAAGQLLLVCTECGVSQTADDVDAGNPVATSRGVSE